MPKICYDPNIKARLKNNPGRMDIVKKAVAIIAEYEADGFDLTLRQVYYQFVARGFLKNDDREYKRLGKIIQEARYAGFIDWLSIVDRTRYLREQAHWRDPAQIVEAVANQFNVDKWSNQDYRVEVWIEKDALVGVIENVCNDLDVPFFSCRGYTSVSELWVAAQRLDRYLKRGQKPVILHFGDHDPSGVDMTRDITDRLTGFLDESLEVRRLALNMGQVQQYNPPPNPAKLTDSRCAGYVAIHGHESWELDALEPRVIAALIRDEIETFRDKGAWAARELEEMQAKEQLQKVSDNWDQIVDGL